MENRWISIARPAISREEEERVLGALRSGELAAGVLVEEFERAFAAFIGTAHAVATSSGTAALCAALRALDLGPGDGVITTPFSFIATANAILSVGAIPIFADVDPDTFNLDPATLEEAIRNHLNCKAILAVHLYGLPAPMEELRALAGEYRLKLIEDCAQAHGAAIGGRQVGTFGHAAAFSFYPTKNMTTGEGGMVVTDDPQVAEKVRRFINHGQKERYLHETFGLNHRMSDLHAAVGIEQLKKLPAMNLARRVNARFYDENLAGKGLDLPRVRAGYVHVYHQYTLKVPGRDDLVRFLQGRGVGCGVYYPRTIPSQPAYRGIPSDPCPVAEELARKVVSIPVHPTLTGEELRSVSAAVNDYFRGPGA